MGLPLQQGYMERERANQPPLTAGEAESQRLYEATFGEKGSTESTSFGRESKRRGNDQSHNDAANSDGLVRWLQTNFDRLDSDKSGKINKTEIEQAMEDPKFATASSAVYLSAMHDQMVLWNRAFEPGDGAPGFSKTGLEKFDLARKDKNLLQSNQEKLDAMHTVWDFSRVDNNWNNQITLDELDKAIANPGYSSEQHRVFGLAKKYYDQLLYTNTDKSKETPEQQEKHRQDGITTTNLNDFPDQKAKEVVFMQNSINYFNRRLDQLHQNPDQIATQGMNNACFFMSPAIQLQMRNPQAIKDMIKDNGDGTRTVTFPGLKDKPITVGAPTEAEMISYANNRDVATLEKAFGLHWYELKKEEAIKDKTDLPEESPVPAERIQFGHATTALEILTGKQSDKIDPGALNENDLDDWLSDAAKKGKQLIVASKDSTENKAYGLTPRHAYMATYDSNQRMLTLRNPLWPNGDPLEPFTRSHKPLDGKDDRQFKVGLAELRVKFFEVATTKD
jgi:hypothetical protein